MEDQDVEVFERIPWESLEPNPSRRWVPYLVATAVVLGAIGVTIGRGMITPAGESPVTPPVPPVPASAGSTEPGGGGVEAPATSPPSPQTTAWSEADLMALPQGSVETAAMAVAEWFVVDHFTRDEGGEGRSFVDWARAAELTWADATTVDVMVLVNRLAADGDDPYQRLPMEAWQVTTELADDRWVVTHGPIPMERPTLEVSMPALDDDVADELAAAIDGRILGAARIDEASWSVGVEWTDAAGLTWIVRDRIDESADN